VDLTYAYTPRAQIASINDQSAPNIDQAFTYDGIGRLTASTGPWGAGTLLLLHKLLHKSLRTNFYNLIKSGA